METEWVIVLCIFVSLLVGIVSFVTGTLFARTSLLAKQITNHYGDLEKRIVKLESGVDNIEKQMGSLQGQIGGLQNSVDTLIIEIRASQTKE